MWKMIIVLFLIVYVDQWLLLHWFILLRLKLGSCDWQLKTNYQGSWKLRFNCTVCKSLQNRHNFLHIWGEQMQNQGERKAWVACKGGEEHKKIALLPSHATCASLSPCFSLCWPKIHKKLHVSKSFEEQSIAAPNHVYIEQRFSIEQFYHARCSWPDLWNKNSPQIFMTSYQESPSK